MDSDHEKQLGPALDEAQQTLESALEEACAAEVGDASTGELIRIEEMLAIAGEAAKEAISIRRRLHEGGARAPRPGRASAASASPADEGAETHRFFEDARGVRWDAFAVYPSARGGPARTQLPVPFQHGWLCFDSADEKRRLSPIPEGWQSIPVDALRRLCDGAELVPRRLGGPGTGRTQGD